MSKQARVGLFTLLGIIGLAWVYYVISNIGERAAGYKFAVHFESAAGLRPAALVYLSGVSIGVVDAINLRKDFSTDVLVAVRKDVDIPVGSRFVINAPLTGEPNLQIVPPVQKRGEPWPPPVYPRVLAEEVKEMPQGTNPATLTDLLEEGQGEVRRVSKILKQLEVMEPELLAQLQETLRSANALTQNANTSLTQLSAEGTQITASLQHSLDQAGSNVVDLTASLNSTARTSSGRVNTLLASLNSAATSLSSSMDSLHNIASNPQVSDNLIATTRSIALTTKTLAQLTSDLQQLTGNPQTQEQLRDTVAQFDAAGQKANSILAQFGGRSNVYGVDPGATPYPTGSGAPPAGGSNTGGTKPVAGGSGLPGAFNAKLGHIIGGIATAQVRVSVLSPERNGTPGAKSPLLTSDQGPQTDVNLILLPNGKNALIAGANNIGASGTTWNLAAAERVGLNSRIGAGIIYSQLGLFGTIRNQGVGIETRLYDPRHPTLDTYANFYLTPKLQLFGGERDIFYPDRRTVFGLQGQL
jgi:ABC-type transporter Mla subunit MlaD